MAFTTTMHHVIMCHTHLYPCLGLGCFDGRTIRLTLQSWHSQSLHITVSLYHTYLDPRFGLGRLIGHAIQLVIKLVTLLLDSHLALKNEEDKMGRLETEHSCTIVTSSSTVCTLFSERFEQPLQSSFKSDLCGLYCFPKLQHPRSP